MHAAFALNKLVRRHVPTLGDRVARAFLVEGETGKTSQPDAHPLVVCGPGYARTH